MYNENLTPPCYSSLRGKLLQKWDRWVYRKATESLRRMSLDNPGLSYLMELHMREWNAKLNISPEVRRITEDWHRDTKKAFGYE
jgi:hypothetical protein